MPAIARVVIDSPLPHLDRPFDYAVSEALDAVVRVGSRVRVRFAGRLVSAVVVERPNESGHEGKLTPLSSCAARPSYTPAALEFARLVARRYGGSWSDALRLMAPPRSAAVEKREWDTAPAWADWTTAAHDLASEWDAYGGADAIEALQAGARVVWEALPSSSGGPDARRESIAARALVAPAAAMVASGRSAIVAVPDARAVASLERALSELGLRRWTARAGGDYAVLDHDDGTAARYGAYLAAMHRHVGLVIGTRPVAMQPVPNLGLLAMWDDAHGAFEEPRAPYPHARTVAALRAEHEGVGLLLGSYAPSLDAVALVEHGWASLACAGRTEARAAAPAVRILGDEAREREGGAGRHWMPGTAWRSLLAGLSAPSPATPPIGAAAGPVAVIVPRTGYVRGLACAACGEWAVCLECGASLAQASGASPIHCTGCDASQDHWHCPECHGKAVRSVGQGVDRIAEQIVAMAPGRTVAVSSGATGVLPDGPAPGDVVVATPGALPAVPGGYFRIVIVDAAVPASGGLGSELHALRLWLTTAALARSREHGGEVTVVGELPAVATRALTTWDPLSAAQAAYAERLELRLPPVTRVVRVTGASSTLDAVLSAEGVVGTLLADPDVARGVSRDPLGATLILTRRGAQQVIDALRAVQQEASRQGSGELRLRVDGPLDLGT